MQSLNYSATKFAIFSLIHFTFSQSFTFSLFSHQFHSRTHSPCIHSLVKSKCVSKWISRIAKERSVSKASLRGARRLGLNVTKFGQKRSNQVRPEERNIQNESRLLHYYGQPSVIRSIGPHSLIAFLRTPQDPRCALSLLLPGHWRTGSKDFFRLHASEHFNKQL